MQVNAVHTLLALLRQQRAAPERQAVNDRKDGTVEELFATAKSTNMRLVMLEKLLQEQHLSVQDAIARSQTGGAEVGERKPYVKLSGKTSDAINKNPQLRHGRSWVLSSSQKEASAAILSLADEVDQSQDPNNYYDGLASPYRPTREDIEAALQNGTKFRPEMAILAKRIQLDEFKNEEGSDENRMNFFFFVIGAIFAVFLLFMFK